MRKTLERNEIKDKVDYYMSLPYTINIIKEDGRYFAEVSELSGCMTEGESVEEVWDLIREAMRGWFEVAIEKNIEIPLPESMKEYSGKFVVRLPKYLHRKLSQLAEKEGVSLNQLVVSLLSEKVGMKEVENKILNKFDELIKLASESLALNKIRLKETLIWSQEYNKITHKNELLPQKQLKRKGAKNIYHEVS